MNSAGHSEESLRILHLEDDHRDADVICLELEKHHCHCQITPVTTKQAFEAAIRQGRFDVILSDCGLPNFDRLEALQLARRTCPEIPFVFVSGHVSPEVSRSALENGAAAFISKNRLSDLISVIEQVCAPALRRIRQTRLPRVGQIVLVRCKGFRCMASLHADGKWRDCFRSQELPEVIEWFEM